MQRRANCIESFTSSKKIKHFKSKS